MKKILSMLKWFAAKQENGSTVFTLKDLSSGVCLLEKTHTPNRFELGIKDGKLCWFANW